MSKHDQYSLSTWLSLWRQEFREVLLMQAPPCRRFTVPLDHIEVE